MHSCVDKGYCFVIFEGLFLAINLELLSEWGLGLILKTPFSFSLASKHRTYCWLLI